MTTWPVYILPAHPRRALWNRFTRLWLRIPSGTLVVLGLLVITGLAHGLQMTVTPALVTTDDEGTYVAQAWAILYMGELAHYTYWYDHPPLGWIQLAGWAGLTGAFERYDSAIAVGREFMLVMKLASVALMYVVSRRLGMNRWFASLAVLLFALTPLGLYFQRLTFLDNITVTWVLAAFALALSPRRKISAFVMSAVCFGIAVLTKETILVIAPAIIYQLWQGTRAENGRMARVLWFIVLGAVGAFYIGMAVIKHELLPGPGHVDLLTAIQWQLFDRASSGSVFDPTSAASVIARSWINLDPWVLGLGIIAAVPALLAPWLRPVALAMIIQVAFMLRPGGYLPQPYLIAMLPFAALLIAGVLDFFWDSSKDGELVRQRRRMIPHTRWSYVDAFTKLPALAMVVALAVAVVPHWGPRVQSLTTDDRNVSVSQTMDWVEANVPTTHPDGRKVNFVVSDAMWVDLKERGYEPEWYFKMDLDPEVKAKYPNGWRDVDYAIFTNEMTEIAKSESKQDMTTTLDAREHGTLVAEFGSLSEKIWIYRVNRETG
jgi:hypothetical protein